MKKGLLHKSKFKDNICSDYPKSIHNAWNGTKDFIELIEENLKVAREPARSREQMRGS